jgi:muramoyltetrapeptide carboxypeptidase LdcA involved in peptidoglycan recycling
MTIRYPAPLQPGDRIGVTSPSGGVPGELAERLAVAVRTVEARGYEVVVGACMGTPSHVSAPAAERAGELTAMLTDPAIRAVVPPWGGETAIDLIPLLDWDAIRAAEPTWFVGFSDIFHTCRHLHGMRLAGFFEGANAVLVGRTRGAGKPTLSQHEAVMDALGGLGVPIVADVECGHVPPFLPLVNGALGRVVHSVGESRVEQVLR